MRRGEDDVTEQLTPIGSGIAGILLVLFGILIMARGRRALSGFRGVALVSGVGSVCSFLLSGFQSVGAFVVSGLYSIGTLAVSGTRIAAFGVIAGVVAMLAMWVEYRLTERRARRLGKGTAPRKQRVSE